MSEHGEQVRRLDEAQAKLRRQHCEFVLTSAPTPMSIADAISILLSEIRIGLVKLEEEAGEAEERLAEVEDIFEVCPSRTFLDYLSRLDFGHGDREDDERLHDALATLRMVVG